MLLNLTLDKSALKSIHYRYLLEGSFYRKHGISDTLTVFDLK